MVWWCWYLLQFLISHPGLESCVEETSQHCAVYLSFHIEFTLLLRCFRFATLVVKERRSCEEFCKKENKINKNIFSSHLGEYCSFRTHVEERIQHTIVVTSCICVIDKTVSSTFWCHCFHGWPRPHVGVVHVDTNKTHWSTCSTWLPVQFLAKHPARGRECRQRFFCWNSPVLFQTSNQI